MESKKKDTDDTDSKFDHRWKVKEIQCLMSNEYVSNVIPIKGEKQDKYQVITMTQDYDFEFHRQEGWPFTCPIIYRIPKANGQVKHDEKNRIDLTESNDYYSGWTLEKLLLCLLFVGIEYD